MPYIQINAGRNDAFIGTEAGGVYRIEISPQITGVDGVVISMSLTSLRSLRDECDRLLKIGNGRSVTSILENIKSLGIAEPSIETNPTARNPAQAFRIHHPDLRDWGRSALPPSAIQCTGYDRTALIRDYWDAITNRPHGHVLVVMRSGVQMEPIHWVDGAWKSKAIVGG